MATLSSSIAMAMNPQTHFLSGSSLKPVDKCFLKISSTEQFPCSSVRAKASRNLSVIVRASRDDGSTSNGSAFVGGFVLGSLIVGALGCIYAPKISEALAGADSKELMRKLPKFIFDEEKALERTRKILTDKIAQLNATIDGISAQLHPDEDSNESAVVSEEIGASTY
ncbi:uncharacterized protein LOC123907426 isoform X1 [Trifolium pratense]|uniref:uncharacterized protein LOC123907426 isoform X1 n=1 Tax=Trifolium pratense TaxID=57577 RepID=UPI001E6910C5|nr:uncharacterized protein LOC123907426 isoform X1 [Trifolium pratense]